MGMVLLAWLLPREQQSDHVVLVVSLALHAALDLVLLIV